MFQRATQHVLQCFAFYEKKLPFIEEGGLGGGIIREKEESQHSNFWKGRSERGEVGE
jgi:hypothetical protein